MNKEYYIIENGRLIWLTDYQYLVPNIQFKCPSCGNKMEINDCVRHYFLFVCDDGTDERRKQIVWIYNSKQDTWRRFYGLNQSKNASWAWANVKRRQKSPVSDWAKKRMILMKKWRPIIFKRDEFKCQACGSKNQIHCHHIIEATNFENIEDSFTDDNLITLCNNCHYQVSHRSSKKEARRIKLICMKHSKRSNAFH